MISISLATHYELYHNWQKALEFCRALPDVGPSEPIVFHMFWRERSGGLWPTVRPFGRKQALPIKAVHVSGSASLLMATRRQFPV